MNNKQILEYLDALNSELEVRGVLGEINLVGGAVMCLVFKSRESTEDIDAIFEPKKIMYECIKLVAETYHLPSDWINDGVKGFLSKSAEFVSYYKLSNLHIWTASPEYMLAMKCLSARMDNVNERDDIKFLLHLLQVKNLSQAVEIILKYYPKRLFQAKTQYAIEEILEELL